MYRLFCFLIVSIMISSFTYTQELNQKYQDPRLDKEVLIGCCDLTGLRWGEFREPMLATYEEFEGDQKVLNKIKDNWQDVSITIVLASWCHDSKVQVPKFLRLLQETGYGDDELTIVAVDRSKEAGELDISELEIEKVPTFIFYRDDKELGRIIESPKRSLEKDTYKIIRD